MSLLFVGPGQAMAIGNRRLALYQPLSSQTAPRNPGAPLLLQAAANPQGWWDASAPSGLLGLGNAPLAVWDSIGRALIDLSGNNRNLIAFSGISGTVFPVGAGHLSGMLGGAGYPVLNSALLYPTLDPTAGWQAPEQTAPVSWTWYLVWSRPNWRQGTNVDSLPVTLLSLGSAPVLQVDSNGGPSRFILFPGPGEVVVSSNMARRHTHSVIVRYDPITGADVWLDGTRAATSVPWTARTNPGPTLLLHDGTPNGGAQCWFHEAAEWNRVLSDGEIAAVASYAGRWTTGTRRGLYLVFNGQSNAINYAMNDGAAMLLARGLAWHVGALACNILATTGLPHNYTMQSGHGIYAVGHTGYPGSFVADPGDGSDPSNWPLGDDGHAVQQAISSLPSDDISDICAIVWPWNETDSLRPYSDLETFQSAATRFISLLRGMLGDVANKIPLIWWNAIPYGSVDGITMHRQVVQALANDAANNVVIGNPQTSDSNARGSSWDPLTGVASGGDASHRDSADNQRFAVLACPIVARALVHSGSADTITTLPDCLPKAGGPFINHVYRENNTTLVVTITHDSGNDLKIPLQASTGIGFAVMDGGTLGSAGPIVVATSCQRIDPTHLRILLASALQSPSSMCHLFYPYGTATIGRGNAITDNFSEMAMPTGWRTGDDLGPIWTLDFPLAATSSGVVLSNSPT